MHVLTINAGSATIKLAVFVRNQDKLTALYNAQADKNSKIQQLEVKEANSNVFNLDFSQAIDENNFYTVAITTFIRWLQEKQITISAVSHRVVHGGVHFSQPILLDDKNLPVLKKLIPLAPLHQPYNIQGIETAKQLLPDCPHIACFDTAFHRTNPPMNQLYAIPATWAEEGIRRYGFHGLSYAYIQQQLLHVAPDVAKKKVIIAHLGQGASLCALNKGKSQLTTMGFSAVDGLMMGTRSGCLDPGVILYWLQEKQFTATQIADLIYKQSGLLGVSKISNDMRALLASSDHHATLAIDMFVQRINQQMGLLIAELQGLDALVFTAGIGEHAASIRAMITQNMQWLGMEIDHTANANDEMLISTSSSKIKTYVIPTNEEYMLAFYATTKLGW